MSARINAALRLLRETTRARLSDSQDWADDVQQRLDTFDRFNGYDRRNNLDLGPTPQVGDKLRASTPGQRANPGKSLP